MIIITVLAICCLLENRFRHNNLFIGENGLAEYVCKHNTENLIINNELNLNKITDIYHLKTENHENGRHTSTDDFFSFYNSALNNVVLTVSVKSNNVDNKRISCYETFEAMFTQHLLKKRTEQLEKNGFIIFRYYNANNYTPYIKINSEQIIILDSKKSFTYNISDIKDIYYRDKQLVIEHNNYKELPFIRNTGNKHKIQLLNICNMQFFNIVIQLFVDRKLQDI